MSIITKLLAGIVTTVIIVQPSLAVEPTIIFDTFNPALDGEIWGKLGINAAGPPLYFYRQLHFKPQVISKSVADDSQNKAQKIKKEKTNNYKILFFSANEDSNEALYHGLGIYIIDLSVNLSIGYCLLEQKSNFNNRPDPEAYKNINQLSSNNQYLKQDLIIPENITLNLYEIAHDGFIERYGIAQMSGRDVVVLDAFYPAELENTLQPYIIEQLNKSLQVNPFDEEE